MEPVDSTTLVQMRVEVLDGVATSLDIVTNCLLFEDFEMWFELLLDWITSGNFYISCSFLSIFYSLCLYLYLPLNFMLEFWPVGSHIVVCTMLLLVL